MAVKFFAVILLAEKHFSDEAFIAHNVFLYSAVTFFRSRKPTFRTIFEVTKGSLDAKVGPKLDTNHNFLNRWM
jgi:hypothetical protein